MNTRRDARNSSKPRTFILKQHPAPPIAKIPAQCEVYDPKTGQTRTLIHASGVTSLWMDELKETELKGLAKKLKPPLFTNGLLTVSPSEKTLIKYLELAAFNESNHTEDNNTGEAHAVLYSELDAVKINKKSMESEVERATMIHEIATMSPDEVKALYLVYYASRGATYESVKKEDVANIRNWMIQEAKNDFDNVAKAMRSKPNANLYYIYEAIDRELIILDRNQNLLRWNTGSSRGEEIIKSNSMDVVEYLAQSAVEVNKYNEVMQDIRSLCNPKDYEDRASSGKGGVSSREMLEMLLESLEDLGAIRIADNGTWIYNVLDENEKWRGKSAFFKAIEEDKNLTTRLRTQYKEHLRVEKASKKLGLEEAQSEEE